MADLLRIDIDGGKYTLVQHEGGGTEILRHGEEWMGHSEGSFPGVKAVLSMGYELEELRKLKQAVTELLVDTSCGCPCCDAHLANLKEALS